MPRKPDTGDAERSRKPLPKDATPQQLQEEVAFLRSKCSSLAMRGHYAECVKNIEDNLSLFYRGERWPEHFFSILRLHQKCYPSLDKHQSHAEYIAPLLRKNGVPPVFAALLQKRDSELAWTAEHFRDLAAECERSGDLETALSYSEIVLKIEPSSANAFLIKGRILDAMGRGREALEMYETALELNPGNRHALNLLARHYMNESPKKALDWVEKAIARTPDDAVNYGLLAEVRRRMKEDDAALEALNQAMTLDPYNPAFPYEKGEILYSQGKRAAAIPLYRMALALDAEHVPSLMRMTELSREVQPELALSYATTAAGLQPDNREALLNKATLLVRTGNREAALRQYRSLLELDGESADANAGLGAVYLAAGEPERALPHLEKAVKKAPDQAGYHLDKARAHRRLEQREAAAGEYKTVTTLDKACADAWGELGDLLVDTNPAEALNCYGKALAIDGKNPAYHAAKGDILLQMPGRHADALDSLSLACQYHPGNAPLHIRLGRLLEEDGNVASAMEHYNKALNITPDDHEAHYLLARLALDTRPDEALLHINAAITHSVTRGDYYFVKTKAILALLEDPQAMLALRQSPGGMGDLGDLEGEDGPRTALVYIDRAIELDPDNPAFLCVRARLFDQMGQTAKAMDQYLRLLKVNPQQHEALFGMACILAKKAGEEKKALDYFSKAIACAPAIAEYHLEKAEFLSGMADSTEEAMACYSAAVGINNQMWRAVLGKARLYERQGDLENAMAEYRRVLLIRPDIAGVSAQMGMLLADIRPQAALVYLNHAVKLEPEEFLHYAWRGRVYRSIGEVQAGDDDLTTALLYGGDRPETRFAVAQILARALPDLALPYCEEALEADGANAQYHLLHGDLLLQKELLGPAREAFQQSVSLDGSCHEAREKLAQTAFLQGDPDAGELVDQALATKPDCPVCLYDKARTATAQGRYPEALELIRQAVNQEPKNPLYRECLVDLLAKTRSLLKLAVERRRLEKLRQELAKPMSIPEPPVSLLEQEEEEEDGRPGEEESPA